MICVPTKNDNPEEYTYKASGYLSSGKYFEYVDTAIDFFAFVNYIKEIYPSFCVRSVSQVEEE